MRKKEMSKTISIDASELSEEEIDDVLEAIMSQKSPISGKLQSDNYENRIIYIDDVIDTSMATRVTNLITLYNIEDDEVPVSERLPIVVFINSDGGSVYDAMAIVDVIESSKVPVTTINIGACCSAAFLVLLAGRLRYGFKHSVYLLHDGSLMFSDSASKVKDSLFFHGNVYDKVIENYVVDSTNISHDLYDSKRRMEWYFLSDEARDLHVIDGIIGDDIQFADILLGGQSGTSEPMPESVNNA